MYGCSAFTYVYAIYVCFAQGSQKRVLGTKGVELEIAVSCHVGTGTWTSRSSGRAASVS